MLRQNQRRGFLIFLIWALFLTTKWQNSDFLTKKGLYFLPFLLLPFPLPRPLPPHLTVQGFPFCVLLHPSPTLVPSFTPLPHSPSNGWHSPHSHGVHCGSASSSSSPAGSCTDGSPVESGWGSGWGSGFVVGSSCCSVGRETRKVICKHLKTKCCFTNPSL